MIEEKHSNTQTNSCNTGSYSRMSEKCQNCDKKEYCDHKRLEMLAYIIPSGNTTGGNLVSKKDFSVNIAGMTVKEATEAINKMETARWGNKVLEMMKEGLMNEQ